MELIITGRCRVLSATTKGRIYCYEKLENPARRLCRRLLAPLRGLWLLTSRKPPTSDPDASDGRLQSQRNPCNCEGIYGSYRNKNDRIYLYSIMLESIPSALATGSTAYDLMNIDNLSFPNTCSTFGLWTMTRRVPSWGYPDMNVADFVAEGGLQDINGRGKTYSFPGKAHSFPVLMHPKAPVRKGRAQGAAQVATRNTMSTPRSRPTRRPDLSHHRQDGQWTGVFDEVCTPYW